LRTKVDPKTGTKGREGMVIRSVCASCLVPIEAQNQTEESKFNFIAGGGLSVPLNPTANYAGVGGNFIGGGYNINKHSSIVGQFMWAGPAPIS
jgi:hypothetical protein